MAGEAPPHVGWLSNTGKTLQTADDRIVELWTLDHVDDPVILTAWARHFREHYCWDKDLSLEVENTGLSKAEFLRRFKFPGSIKPPGPSTRSGDFGEILIADFMEYIDGCWCPRHPRYQGRINPDVPTSGTDVLAFKFADAGHASVNDELHIVETKASLRPTQSNRLQDAINDSIKDDVRVGFSLVALKQRFLRTDLDKVAKIQRFQEGTDKPFKRIHAAATILDSAVLAEIDLPAANASQHPNVNNLRLIVVSGPALMDLVTALYERAASEA